MQNPWQMQPVTIIVPMGGMPLMRMASGGFPVPQAMSPEDFPPAVQQSILRILEGPPKPSVTLDVMNKAQSSMIAPDLPYRADV